MNVQSKKWMKISELAGYLGVHRETAYRYVKKGILPHYRVGNLMFVSKEDVDKAMLSFRQEGVRS